jgi:hypothetical protein
MLSALPSTPGAHLHTPWPVPGSPWCPQCSARLDWQIRWLDVLAQRGKEAVCLSR